MPTLQDDIAAWLLATRAPQQPDFSVTTTPADGLVDMAKPSQPKVDWTALAIEGIRNLQFQAPQQQVVASGSANVGQQPTPWANAGIRLGGGIVGGLVGSLAGPVGTATGAAMGSALASNEIAQPREVAQGTRTGVNPLTGFAEGAANMLPVASVGAGPLLRQFPKVMGSAAAGSAAGSMGVQLADAGRIDPMQTLQETALGTLMGTGVAGGIAGATRVASSPRVRAAATKLATEERGALGPLDPTKPGTYHEIRPSGERTVTIGKAAEPVSAPVAPSASEDPGQWSRIAGENLGPTARGVLDDVPVPADMAPGGIPPFRLQENTDRAFRFLDRHEVSDDLKQVAKDLFTQGEDAYAQVQRRMGLTWEQTDALASQIVPEVKLPKGSVTSPEELGALRRATFGLIDRAATVSEDVATLRRIEGALAQQSPEALAAQADIFARHGVPSMPALILKEKAAVEEAITAQRSLMGVRSEFGRGLNYLKSLQSARAMDDSDFLAAALKSGAVPEEAMAALRNAPNPEARYRFIRGLSKPGAQDYWKWYAMTAYLSGPVTQWRNIAGNAINFGAEAMLVQPVAAGIDAIRNPGNRTVRLGENQAAAAGLSSGFLDGVAKGLYYFRNGFTEADAGTIADIPPEVFGGKLLPNVIGRSMGAVDQFFRTVGLHMELHRQAMLQGVKEGLEGDALKMRVTALVNDPTITPEVHKRASRYAAGLTFQEKNADDVAGAMVGGIAGIARGLDRGTKKVADVAWDSGLHKLGKMGSATYGLMSFPPSVIVAPFINTPFNILKRAGEYGFGSAAAVKGGDRAAMLTAARGAIGLASVGVAAGLYQQGFLTGAPPEDPAERDAFYATKRPYAIRVGDQWVSYQSLGPIGMVLGAAANYMQAAEKNPKDALGKFGQMVSSTGKMVIDSSFLRGMYNLLDAVVNFDRTGDKWAARTATGLIPAAGALRFVRDQVDPTLRNPDGVMEQIKASVPGLSTSVVPRIDYAGEEIKRPSSIAPTEAKTDPLRSELLRLKLATSEGYLRDPLSAAKGLQTKINSRLKKAGQPPREVSREQQIRYGTQYGKLSARVLGQIIQTPAYQRLDDEGKRTMIERTKQAITEQVDAAFIGQYLGG